MSRQEMKHRSNRKRQRALAKRRMMLLLVTLLLITVGTVVFGSSFTFAKDNESAANQQFKYYKSVMIEAGDSLWSIAEEYKTEHYANTQEYIDELVDLNNLSSETIHAGQYLMIIYYDSEFK